MIKKIALLIFICTTTLNVCAQKSTVWLTYSQSKFIYSPGIEYAYFFTQYIGLQAAVNIYTQNPNPAQVTGINEGHRASPFYNANVGVTSYIWSKENYQIAANVGLKLYYGSNFHRLHYYEAEDYYIYYDSFDNAVVYGVDMGLSFTYNKISCLLKYDTAYNKVRVGFGYAFGTLK